MNDKKQRDQNTSDAVYDALDNKPQDHPARTLDPHKGSCGATILGDFIGFDDGQDRWVLEQGDYCSALEDIREDTDNPYQDLCDATVALWSRIGSGSIGCGRDPKLSELEALMNETTADWPEVRDFLGFGQALRDLAD